MPKMATRQNPETETSRHRYAADLARWDNEGGAPAPLASEAVSEASQGTRSSLDHRNDATLGRRQRVMAGRYERHTTLIKRPDVATKERLAAMAASLCAVCSGRMVVTLVIADPSDRASELRTYACAECGHSRTYSVDDGDR